MRKYFAFQVGSGQLYQETSPGIQNHHKVKNYHRIIVAAASTSDKNRIISIVRNNYYIAAQLQLLPKRKYRSTDRKNQRNTKTMQSQIGLWGTPRVGDQTSFLMHIREMKFIFIKHHLKYQERDIQQKHAQQHQC